MLPENTEAPSRSGHDNASKGEHTMRKYILVDPSGETITTMATSLAEAKSNFAYRLSHWPYGMFVADAKAWAADTKEASK